MSHFSLPDLENEEQKKEMLKMVKHWTLKKMAELFRGYKKRLWATYKRDKKAPKFEGPLELQGRAWPAFVVYKESEDAKKKSAKNKANAQKKLYHHKMGTGGYRAAMPK